MPFSVQFMSPSRPSLDGRQRRLSTEEANRIIRIARRKSLDGASQKDRNLRVFLGHSHIAETLKHEFGDVDQSSHDVKPHSPSRPQTIHWADLLPAKTGATEDEALAFEDDGEEDFGSLALVRTPSRSAQSPTAPV
jgi:hypothetical protein